MTRDPAWPRRHTIRLPGYDYAQPGAYYLTLCTHERACVLGEVVAGAVRLNALGEVMREAWQALPAHFAHVYLDAYVIMPNHIHGIIVLTPAGPGAADRRAGAACCQGTGDASCQSTGDACCQSTGDACVARTEDLALRWAGADVRGLREAGEGCAPCTGAACCQGTGDACCQGTGDACCQSTGDACVARTEDPALRWAGADVRGLRDGGDASAGCTGDACCQGTGDACCQSTGDACVAHPDHRAMRPRGPKPASIGAIVGAFKSAAARRINALRGAPGAPVWHRNYYEHIVRNTEDLARIREYIANNPIQWATDEDNPLRRMP